MGHMYPDDARPPAPCDPKRGRTWDAVPLEDRFQLKPLRDRLERWGVLWGVPALSEEIALRTSSRMRTSLGSYRAHRAELTLAEWLLDGPETLLEEVLGHEAAHAAVHSLHGRRAKSHGPEWRALMEQAGLPPRVRVPWSALPAGRRVAAARRGLWEHRCPICQATRVARTRVPRWRCRSCREMGREGHLVIHRLPTVVGIDR
jgi:predicted SprT family Zn-dependent metalloprotease